MIAPISDSNTLGHLDLVEIFDEIDGPRLFSCRSDSGQLYVALWVAYTNDAETWLYLPVSEQRYRLLTSATLDLREGLTRSESGAVFKVVALAGRTPPNVEPLDCRRIPADWLPERGEFLDAAANAGTPASQPSSFTDNRKAEFNMTPLESLVATGTKLWLDSVDPEFVKVNRKYGATGATSNPVIISDLIKTGRFDDDLLELMEQGLDDEAVAWQVTDRLVRQAQEVFLPVWEETAGDNGYVSFELDPLLEDAGCPLSVDERTARYIELGRQWSAGHRNRMIKVPGTPAGLAALEELAAAGVTLNVTLLFTDRQYHIARDAIWRGAQRRDSLERFKSVYSIFISRIDVYTKQHVPELSPAAQGEVGIVNAKRLWQDNEQFWRDKNLPLKQEFIFASTGTKDPSDPPDKYVVALAGSDIQTNPPATNDAIQHMAGKTFTRTVDQFPPDAVLAEIDEKVDFQRMEEVLMDEGLKKFADPQKALLALIAEKRAALLTTGR